MNLAYLAYLGAMLDHCSNVFFLSHCCIAINRFDQTTYSVREDAGNVTIGVSVLSGTPVGDVTLDSSRWYSYR